MPNLHGLAATLNGHLPLEISLVAVLCLAFLWITLKTDNYEFLLAICLVCGLLVSYHSAIFDDVLLFAVFVLMLSASESKPVRSLSALILTPVFYFMALSNSIYSTALPLFLLLLLVLAGLSLSNRASAVHSKMPLGATTT
jgi:hypothetical protein